MTTELFKIMAESRSRHAQVSRIHQASIAQLPTAINGISAELDRLRAISPQWLGQDQAIEQKYMRLLEQRRQLQQSYEMGAKPAAAEEIDPQLRKAIEYGRLLLDIYGGGALVKGAAGDVQRWGEKLVESGNSVAWAIGRELLGVKGE